LGAIAVALRTRRRRERYPETYAATGGVFYTAVQIGCGTILLLGGLSIVLLALIFKR
jgi:NhaP-type Na+/H+ or K+/H+ antiporter